MIASPLTFVINTVKSQKSNSFWEWTKDQKELKRGVYFNHSHFKFSYESTEKWKKIDIWHLIANINIISTVWMFRQQKWNFSTILTLQY